MHQILPQTVLRGDVTVEAGRALESRVVTGIVTMEAGSSLRNCTVSSRSLSNSKVTR